MGILDRLLKTEQNLRKRIENAFGDGAAQTPLEVRREILERVEAHIIADKGGKSFPYSVVEARMHPRTEDQAEVFRAAFVENDTLNEDVRELLASAGARFPRALRTTILVEEIAAPDADIAPFTLHFVRPQDAAKPERPQARLVVTKGITEQPEYDLKKERCLIGRLAELTDRDGQMARRNDIVFLDSGDEVNSTVGRAHAAVCYDPEKREYRIVDEVSRYGTRIFREGRSIEVPGGNPRGIKLKAGDEIYVGRACLLFQVVEKGE